LLGKEEAGEEGSIHERRANGDAEVKDNCGYGEE